MNRAPIRSLEYVAVGHPDHRAQYVAALLLQHADDPWELAERIVDWAESEFECGYDHELDYM